MSKVYKQKPLAPDELLGRVASDGKVYEGRFGPDKYVGRVETETGRVYEARFGLDKYIGRVALDTGKIFHAKFGPDEYLGRVGDDGKLFRHKPLAPDEYVGKITDLESYAHGGAAFLLLVWPAFQADLPDEHEEQDAE